MEREGWHQGKPEDSSTPCRDTRKGWKLLDLEKGEGKGWALVHLCLIWMTPRKGLTTLNFHVHTLPCLLCWQKWGMYVQVTSSGPEHLMVPISTCFSYPHQPASILRVEQWSILIGCRVQVLLQTRLELWPWVKGRPHLTIHTGQPHCLPEKN